jgi:mevalonate kinase
METKVSHARFYVLLRQIPQADKEEFVWQYSHLKTTSLSEFYESDPAQYRQMINDMQKLVNEMDGYKPNDAKTAELKKLRSAILHRLQKHGIDTTDWNRVNAFMRQPRIAGKTLGEMSIEEMKELIPKMQSILAKDRVKQKEIERLQQLN